jgi:hypothetical protein
MGHGVFHVDVMLLNSVMLSAANLTAPVIGTKQGLPPPVKQKAPKGFHWLTAY